ncbi:Nif11-like leader peptide family natural product precursor [Nocardiopsis sp. CNT-189]|uniref:Nif11-like leader peptide family natural product precursor n=1 Tax=Nocardiopsis oceanisediminis TaxID=2816862 RepID=UPI003B324397
MSVDVCTEFLKDASSSPELQRRMRTMTGLREIVRLGDRNGYAFDEQDLITASSVYRPEEGDAVPSSLSSATAAPPPAETSFLHYEYAIADLPGFEEVAELLPRLKIRPPSVDAEAFRAGHREDDRLSMEYSPTGTDYARWRARLPEEDAARRAFHLVNLDEHVDHPGYDDYLDAKAGVLAALDRAFGSEVRFSGSMWYPPGAYRLWHTNENQPGWRMYIIDFDAPFEGPGATSFFRYRAPGTGELVTLPERPGLVRFFRVEQEPERLFWHCIGNPTPRDRWSFGFVVPDDWAARFAMAAGRGA